MDQLEWANPPSLKCLLASAKRKTDSEHHFSSNVVTRSAELGIG
jgi:hypothetical protein